MVFYCDASIPEAVAQALTLARDDVLYPGQEGCPVRRRDTKDPVWLQIAGARDWVVLMRDKHIRMRPGERRALRAAGVRAFVMTGGGQYTRWETLDLLVRRWSEIEAVATSLPGPYISR